MKIKRTLCLLLFVLPLVVFGQFPKKQYFDTGMQEIPAKEKKSAAYYQVNKRSKEDKSLVNCKRHYKNGKKQAAFTKLADDFEKHHGTYLSYWRNGTVRFECTYQFGLKEGEGILRDEDGSTFAKGKFVKDERHGYWTEINSYDNQIQQFYHQGTPIGDSKPDPKLLGKVGLKLAEDGQSNFYYGYVNLQGEIQIPVAYDGIYSVSDSTFIAKKGRKTGVISRNNETRIPFDYDFLYKPQQKAYFFAQNNGKSGYIDMKNKVLIPLEYEYLGAEKDGLILAKKEGKYGYITLQNKIVFAFEYEEACHFVNGKAHIKKDGTHYFLARNGQLTPASFADSPCNQEPNERLPQFPNNFDKKLTTHNGEKFWLEVYRAQNGQVGVKDQKRNVLIAAEYDAIPQYLNGVITVEKEGLFGYFKDTGEMLVAPIYHVVFPFEAMDDYW